MAIVLTVVAVLVVVAIALVVVGRVTHELATRPPPSVFDLDEATDWVADRLAPDVAGRLTHDDVRRVLGWQLDYLEGRGVASEIEASVLADEGDQGPVVVDEEVALGYVLGEVGRTGLDLADDDVALVLDEGATYLAAIGALGDAVASPPDPEVGPVPPVDPSEEAEIPPD